MLKPAKDISIFGVPFFFFFFFFRCPCFRVFFVNLASETIALNLGKNTIYSVLVDC